jgi:MFS family permease
VQTPNTFVKLGLLGSAYVCQAVPVGFCWVGLPLILRQEGAGLQMIGWLALLYAPWALKFLWSPWVDRYYLPCLGRRRTWIFPLQWLAAISLVALAAFPPTRTPAACFFLLFCANLVYATNDIAVDGYATDILAPEDRSFGNGIQMGGGYLGQMLGGGLFVAVHGLWGWQNTLLAMAGFTFFLSLPMVFCREIPPVFPNAARELFVDAGQGLLSFFKAADTRWTLLWMALLGGLACGGLQMRVPLLSDLGFDESGTAAVMLRFGYPFGLAGTLAGALFLRRWGARLLLWVCGIFATGICLLTVQVVSGVLTAPGAVAAMIAWEQMMLGASQVLVYTVIMAASAGPRSGTHYAALCSSFHLIFLVQAPLAGILMDTLGYTGGYLFLAVLFPVLLVAASLIGTKINIG